jgi:hypothetical protein
MTDYFISELPSGHAVKDITKAAAAASLRGDTIVTAAPANTVPLLRRQCAAVVWLRSDVCTADNLEKLALADADSSTVVPAKSSLGAPPTTLSYIPETAAPLQATAAPLRATAAAVPRRAGVPHLAEGPHRAAVLRPAEAAALPGGLYLRRSSLRLRFLHSIFSAGQTWHSSSTGQAYLTTPATKNFTLARHCLDRRATLGPNQRSRPAGPSPFASHEGNWRPGGLEVRTAGQCILRYPKRV